MTIIMSAIGAGIVLWTLAVPGASANVTPIQSPSCTEARHVASDPGALPGALTVKVIDCTEEILLIIGKMVRNEVETEHVALAPFLAAYDEVVAREIALLRSDTLPGATEVEFTRFEDLVRTSFILNEVAAVQDLLDTPSGLLMCDRNGDGVVDRQDIGSIFAARNTMETSKLGIVKAVAGTLQDILSVFGKHVEDKKKSEGKKGKFPVTAAAIQVKKELLKIFNGKHPTTVNDARVCALQCTNPGCAP
jgi:hypothetical protein